MPTRKIADLPTPYRHPEHNPPNHQLFDDGIYEHTCPACGHSQRFVVSKPMLMARVEPPAHPVSLGEVWVGNTRPTAEVVAKFGNWPCY